MKYIWYSPQKSKYPLYVNVNVDNENNRRYRKEFYCCNARYARDLMLNFHPILFKFCAYVKNMLDRDNMLDNMHREREFPMTIYNLAALFCELLERPSYTL